MTRSFPYRLDEAALRSQRAALPIVAPLDDLLGLLLAPASGSTCGQPGGAGARIVAALGTRPWLGRAVAGCPAGWLLILEHAVAAAELLIPADVLAHAETSHVEEAGQLRWYFSAAPMALDPMVRLAERASLRVCRICGAPAELLTRDSRRHP
jgi:hypothetical protein